MTNKVKHKLELLKVGNKFTFPDDEDVFVVKKVGFRYIFAGTENGWYYTIIDKVGKTLSTTNRTFEEYGVFTKEINVDKLEELLYSGKVELSQKYVTTFKEFSMYGGEVFNQ